MLVNFGSVERTNIQLTRVFYTVKPGERVTVGGPLTFNGSVEIR